MQAYETIAAPAQAEFVEKRSRFIGYIAPVKTEEEAMAFLSEKRAQHWDATHNVYAYLLRENQAQRYSDDGEPQGTAGQPVLEVLRREGLTDVIVVVTRYFGGILLGTGGLVRAYTAAASGALAAARIVTMRQVVRCRVRLPYARFEQAQRLVAAAGGRLEDPVYDDAVTLCWKMPAGTEAPLCAALGELTRGDAQVQVSPPEYAAF